MEAGGFLVGHRPRYLQHREVMPGVLTSSPEAAEGADHQNVSAFKSFKVISVDFLEYVGRTYLVHADRLAGWLWVSYMVQTVSAHQLTGSLRQAFKSMGVSSLLLSDGDLQLTVKKSREFLQEQGIPKVLIKVLSTNCHRRTSLTRVGTLRQR